MDKNIDTLIRADKENIKRRIRYCLSSKRTPPIAGKDGNDCQPEPIENLFVHFVEKFRAAGGKYIPCTPQNIVELLVKITKSQGYSTLLTTSPDIATFLNRHGVRYVSAINTNTQADAAIFFSDMLISRTGAIGFAQEVARYASVRNLAKDIIVFSRSRCVFQDVEDALNYRIQRNEGIVSPIVEFLIPTKPEEINGVAQYSARASRFILMMIDDGVNCTAAPKNQSENQSVTTAPSTTILEIAPQTKQHDTPRVLSMEDRQISIQFEPETPTQTAEQNDELQN